MIYTCKYCKFGLERSPDGQRLSNGTVWCGKRKIAMGQNRNLPCFVPPVSVQSKRCRDCSRAKKYMPAGRAPSVGKVWCERRHIEINKLRIMECFE
ncbi:hypothetical protein BMS3Abin07_01945 [bacterium BMS3Abin07]|nr:hypothetical protein BMS3Abin07_01945 [bacterium BMS3Abin07]HDL20090.1 hypothetical protein [Nitrospirota bacterium]HDO22438.1 hypothetical protein [Nitrospirota bacterium]HDZ87480.1 hypothetical protein [Nitrospirota bacterium]